MATPDGWPAGDLDSLLARFAGARASVFDLRGRTGKPLGNNGDAIMHHAFQKKFDDLNIVESATEPDVLIVPPNGALLDSYGMPRLLRDWLINQPDIPLVIFPSSALFNSWDPAEIFAGRTAETVWILREEHSFRHLMTNWGPSLSGVHVELHLDHDMVVTGRKHVVELVAGAGKDRAVQQSGLLVARLGVEGKDMRSGVVLGVSRRRKAAVNAYNRLPSDVLKRVVRRQVVRDSQRSANADLLARLPEDIRAEFGSLPGRQGWDISDPTLVSFDNYLSCLAGAEVVATNRLHVALPAAALGARTFLVESGYHKLRGVYERSLVDVPNITLVRAPGWE